MALKIDKVDRKIIALLQSDARITNKSIAAELAISESTVANRLNRLVEAHVLRITVEEDAGQFGYDLYGVANVETVVGSRDNVAAEIAKMDASSAVLTITGMPEITVLFFARDYSHVASVVDRIGRLPGVIRVNEEIASEIYRYVTAFAILDNDFNA